MWLQLEFQKKLLLYSINVRVNYENVWRLVTFDNVFNRVLNIELANEDR